jgi:hypothetical protein
MRVLLVALVLLQAPVPVEQEPRHKTVYSDQHMRVLDVNIPFGDTTLEHAHRYDIATVCIECSDTQSREAGGEWGAVRKRAPGSWQVTEYARRPGAHSVRTVAEGRYHLVAVENLGRGGFQVKEHTLAGDGLLDPHTHRVPTVVVKMPGGHWQVVRPGVAHTVVAAGEPVRVVEIEVRP